jgi:hypothetical protein
VIPAGSRRRDEQRALRHSGMQPHPALPPNPGELIPASSTCPACRPGWLNRAPTPEQLRAIKQFGLDAEVVCDDVGKQVGQRRPPEPLGGVHA